MGCAFAACLERKQKREKECGVTATFDANRTTFTREGSFRVTTATEAAEREEVMRQLQDAKKGLKMCQLEKLSREARGCSVLSYGVCFSPAEAELSVSGNTSSSGTSSAGPHTGSSTPPTSSPPPSVATLGPQVIPRRHAPADVIARQGSFRGFPVLSQKTSPFKRQLSLRMNELPSTVQRKSDFPMKNTGESGRPRPPLTPEEPSEALSHGALLISVLSPRGRRRR